MRRLIPVLVLVALSSAIAHGATYKPPKAGPTATIRLSAPNFAGGHLLRNAHLEMVVQRIQGEGKECNPETLGWIAYKKDKTYAITAEKIASFGVKHNSQSLTAANQGTRTFAFIPERDHIYEFAISIGEGKVDVKVFDETAGYVEVPVDIHYLVICARQVAAQNKATS